MDLEQKKAKKKEAGSRWILQQWLNQREKIHVLKKPVRVDQILMFFETSDEGFLLGLC